jgi:hypothetical protein
VPLYIFRYGFLLSETNVSQDPLSISVAVLKQFNVLPEMYQVGYTKLFLRTGQVSSYIYVCACMCVYIYKCLCSGQCETLNRLNFMVVIY